MLRRHFCIKELTLQISDKYYLKGKFGEKYLLIKCINGALVNLKIEKKKKKNQEEKVKERK